MYRLNSLNADIQLIVDGACLSQFFDLFLYRISTVGVKLMF